MNINFKCSKTESLFASNERISYCKCLQPVKIILLRTSKQTKYIISLKPRKTKVQDKTSLDSQTQNSTRINDEASFHGEKYVLDRKLVPRLSLFNESIQKSEKSSFGLKAKKCRQNLKHQATNVFRLSGGWGQDRLTNMKKSSKTKQKFKTTNKTEPNTYEKSETTFDTSANGSTSRNSTALVEKLLDEEKYQTDEKFSENQEIEGNSFVSSIDNMQCISVLTPATVLEDKKQTLAHQKFAKTPTEFLTSSYIENLIDEICPVLSRECDIGIQRADSEEIHPQDAQPYDKEIRKKIDSLEEQVNKMNFELKNLQTVSMSSSNIKNLSKFSEYLSEVNTLLVELKENISKLQNIIFQINQGKVLAENNEDERICQNCLPNAKYFCFKGRDCRYIDPQQYPKPLCNCEIYKRTEMPFAKRKCTESVENWSSICNCIKYLNKSRECAHQTEQNVGKCNLISRNKVQVTGATSQRYRKSENSNFISHQQLLKEKGQAVNYCCREENDESLKQSWHAEYPPTMVTDNKNPIQPAYIDDEKNFHESFIAGSSASELISSSCGELPLATQNISKALWKIIGNIESDKIALTIYHECNNLYFINVSLIRTGQCLGYIYTNESAFRKAKEEKIFDNFLLFSVLNSDNFLEERNQQLRSSFEFINLQK